MEKNNNTGNNKELDILLESISDIENNILLYGEGNIYEFKNYYILNKDWYDKYVQSISFKSKENLFLISDFLFPVLKEKKINEQSEINKFLIPTNFAIINEQAGKIISKNFDEKENLELNNLIHEVLIFGECIIIKSLLKQNTLYISLMKKEKKENETIYENDINYIFNFNTKDDMESEIKFMKNFENFNKYFQFKNLNENIDFREIYDSNDNIIGKIIYNKIEKEDSTHLMIQKNNPSLNSKNDEKFIAQVNPFFKPILLGLSRFEKLTQGFKEIITSNNNLKLTKQFSLFFDNISKGNIYDNMIETEFVEAIKTEIYENIIKDIFDKLDLELNPNNNNTSLNLQSNQSEQIKAENDFKLKHNNPSIIENMCYITATELKNNLGHYLELSSKEDVFITKNGKPIAVLSATVLIVPAR